MQDQMATATGSGWFSVRCVYQFNGESPSTYEERVTIWRASDIADAIRLAETEAQDYAADVDAEYLGFAQAYILSDGPEHGAEVFSLMRDSQLGPTAYLDTFFDTGHEREGKIGDQ